MGFLRLSYVSAWLRPEQNQGGILAGACRKADRYISKNKKTTTTGSESLLFSLGLDIDGESIDRSSSPTSLTNIRYNLTSRHGKKKELRHRFFSKGAFLR